MRMGLSKVFLLCLSSLMIFIGQVSSFASPGNGNISTSVSLDTTTIRIGEQVRLYLRSDITGDIDAGWFDLRDTIAGLDVVSRTGIDTSGSGDTVTYTQIVILTGWDSGYYVIPPLSLPYRLKGDTTVMASESEALLLEVMTVEVDTTRSIRDIKDLKQIPYTWQDALPYVFGTAILLLLIWLGVVLWKRYRNKDTSVKPVIPARPPYDVAMEQLDALRMKKLWQQGHTKQYYTELIDILRVFISGNWNMNALEMTSDEILDLHMIRNADRGNFEELSQLLTLSDLVKFARSNPAAHENEHAIDVVRKFIENNKPSPEAANEKNVKNDV